MTERLLPNDLISDLEQDLSFTMRVLECLHRRREFPVERAQYLVLLQLLEGARPSGELAARLKLDHSTVTRQVAALERNGHIIRRSNPVDGRSMLVELTELGRSTCLIMRKIRIESVVDTVYDWTDSEVEMFSRLLKRFQDRVFSVGDMKIRDEEAAIDGGPYDTALHSAQKR